MPIYHSLCHKCGTYHEYVAKVADYLNSPDCCGEKTEKQIDCPMIGAMTFSGWKGFNNVAAPGTPWVESGSEYKKWLKDNNKIPMSEGQQEADRVSAQKQVEDKKKRKEAVRKAADQIFNK